MPLPELTGACSAGGVELELLVGVSLNSATILCNSSSWPSTDLFPSASVEDRDC